MTGSPRRAPAAGPAGERGTVTAETAVLLPALVILLVVWTWGIRAAAAQVACVDAARVGARAAARGEAVGAVRAVTESAAPASARVEVRQDVRFVHVTVVAEVRAGGGLAGDVMAVTVGGDATALREGR